MSFFHKYLYENKKITIFAVLNVVICNNMEKIAYKLFRELKNGEITSLFINKSKILPHDKWMDSDCFPTKGFAIREGWHCTATPNAPHLKMKLKSGEVRVWKKVMIENFTEFKRPEKQGGLWYLAKKMKILHDK